MTVDLSIQLQDWRIIIPPVAGLIGFIIYWFTERSPKIRDRFLKHYGHDRGWTRFITFTKYLGGISIGVMPLAIFWIVFPDTSFRDIGIYFNPETIVDSVLWILGIGAILIPVSIISAKRPENLLNYPRIRAKVWNRRMLWGNLLSWAFYLLLYECYFRGLLLFPLIDAIGLWPAIAINVVMYSGTHLPKGRGEAIGAIPLAVVLSLMTLQTGNIWAAVVVHIAMAWSNSLTSLKHNSDMVLISNRAKKA